ncbi:auxin-regulated gene involved in organ size [Euphorbia peplus]|nr:auxin-regulated gene involved in organ size [Euphorbia peplus]
MRFTQPESEPRYSRSSSLINLEDHLAMDIRGRNVAANQNPYRSEQVKKMEYQRKLTTQGSGIRLLPSSYFSIESLFLLICLTATLLILPLILPPLPPPPFMLLLLPIGILAVLMILAFMPATARDLTTLTNV